MFGCLAVAIVALIVTIVVTITGVICGHSLRHSFFAVRFSVSGTVEFVCSAMNKSQVEFMLQKCKDKFEEMEEKWLETEQENQRYEKKFYYFLHEMPLPAPSPPDPLPNTDGMDLEVAQYVWAIHDMGVKLDRQVQLLAFYMMQFGPIGPPDDDEVAFCFPPRMPASPGSRCGDAVAIDFCNFSVLR